VKLWQAAAQRIAGDERSMSINELIRIMAGLPLGQMPQTIQGDREDPPSGFDQFAISMFGANPVVWTAEMIRKAVFSQARLQWRNQQTGALFGDESLSLLENPWHGGTTSKLLTRMLLHADIGGNAYVLEHRPGALQLMRPDWVSIVLGSQLEPQNPVIAEDAELVGYV
jgi:hypothetical protein